MSDAIERINEIFERSYVKYNFLDENNRPQIKGKAYRIDDQRSFQVFSFMNGDEEITIAAVFYDYDEVKLIEYNYSGESEDFYAPEEEEPVLDEPSVQ
jgi:hypothetical protein